MKNLLNLLVLLLFTPFAGAQINSENATISDYFYSNSNAYNPDGVWLFLGSNIGLVDLSDSTKLPNRDGHQVNFKAVGSLYKLDSQIVSDIGIGFQSNSTSGLGVKFTTQSFFIDANARWEFTDRWTVGPVVNLLVGNKNSFTNKKKALASFIGATVHYRHPINKFWLLKVGGRFLTDIDVGSRQVNKWLLDFQIGFPPGNNGGTVISQENTNSKYNTTDTNLTAEQDFTFDDAEFNTIGDNDQNNFDSTKVNTLDNINNKPFASFKDADKVLQQPVINIKIDDVKYKQGQVQPSLKDERYLRQLAKALSENQDLFDQVNVKGHAGDFIATVKNGNTNRIISKSRANDILKRLATNGLPSSKIFSMSFGEYNPNKIDTSKQKVELEFSGVKNEAKLRNIINSIQL